MPSAGVQVVVHSSAGLQAHVSRVKAEGLGLIPAKRKANTRGFSPGDFAPCFSLFHVAFRPAWPAFSEAPYQGTTSVEPTGLISLTFRAGFSPRGGANAAL